MDVRKDTKTAEVLDSNPIKNLEMNLKTEEDYQDEHIIDITTRKRPHSSLSADGNHIKKRFQNTRSIFNCGDKEPENVLINKKQKTCNGLSLIDDHKGEEKVTIEIFDDIYMEYLTCKKMCIENKKIDVKLETLFKGLIAKCIKEHLLDKIPFLISDFLTTISKLLRQPHSPREYKVIEELLTDCFNIISADSKVEFYYEILLQDYYRYNYDYLGVLKLVTLQLILTQRDQNDKIKGCLLTLLAYDNRFLFGFDELTINKIKIVNLIKLLLHTSSFSREIKFFSLCKILQYTKEHSLDINRFLPQINQNKNIAGIIKESYKLINTDNNIFAHCFVSKIGIKIPLHPVKEAFTLDDIWRTKLENTFKSSKNSIKLYEFYNHYSSYLWTHACKIEKRDLNIIKKILIKVNDSLSFIKTSKNDIALLISSILLNTMNILISINDLHTLNNLTNILFNIFVTIKDDLFLKYSINSNLHIFLNTKRGTTLYEESLDKFLKYIKSLISMEMRISLFKQLFNINSLQSNISLANASSFVIDHCHQYYELLPNLNMKDLRLSSDLMNCLLISGAKHSSTSRPSLNLVNEWSLILKMLFQVISPEIDVIIINFDEPIVPNTCLYNERHFVKCCFQFYREMKKRSMMKLFKIGDYYLNNVLSERAEQYEMSSIEKEFLKVLFQYLKLNGFYQLDVKLYQTIHRIKNVDIELLKELKKTYLQIKHCLLGLNVNSLSSKMEICSNDIDFQNLAVFLEQLSTIDTLESFKNLITSKYLTIWDYTNRSQMSKPLYIKILLFNMSFAIKEGDLLELEQGHHVEALQSYKHVLSLGKSILKFVDSLAQITRITVINNILVSFEKIFEVVLLLGNYLYYEYFIKEFDIILSFVNEPMIKFKKYSLSIQFAELVFNKLEKFQQNILKQVDLSNSDLVFLEYCERENKLEQIFETYQNTKFKIYKDLLLKNGNRTNNSKRLLHSLETPLGRLHCDSSESCDYRKLSLFSVKHKLEKSSTYLSYWNDCYKTMGITYEKQLTENVSDFSLEDNEFGNTLKENVFDIPINSKVLSLDYNKADLLIGIVENGIEFNIRLILPNDSIASFSQNLNKITKESNDSTSVQVTSKITTKEQRKEWWIKRYSLDSKLEELLKAFAQDCEFKKLEALFDQKELDINHIDYKKLETNLHRNGLFNIPSLVIRLLHSGMSTDTLRYLGLINERVDYKGLLAVIKLNNDLINKIYIHYDHTFLVLTDLFHSFPWEVISIFENKNITRVPSLTLLKRLLTRNSQSAIKLQQSDISLVLNPNNDLPKTQQNFEPIFDPILKNKTIGNPPKESQFIEYLTNSKLFIYLGHGNGIQYTSSKMLKKLQFIAPSLLIGCSSVKVTTNNKFFGYGTLLSYLIGGCPLVLGNLWDVTDKDIDAFSISLFSKLGIINNDEKAIGESIDSACRKSRKECRLRYLNGGAPVVYGLPLRFELE